MSQLTCRQCGVPLRARDVDFEQLRARCRACGWELGTGNKSPFRRAGGAQAQPDAAVEIQDRPNTARRARVDIPCPHTLTIRSGRRADGERQLVIAMPWYVFRPFPRNIVFGGALLLMFATMLADEVGVSIGTVPVVVGLVLLGVVIAVHLVFASLNRVEITVDRDQLVATHGPIPWAAYTFDMRGVTQIWVEEEQTLRRPSQFVYHLRCRRRGTDETLWSKFIRVGEPLYLEQRLESFLRIDDEPVFDEYQPR